MQVRPLPGAPMEKKRTKKELFWALNWFKQICGVHGSRNMGPKVSVSIDTELWVNPRVIYPHEAPGRGTMQLNMGVLVGWQIYHLLELKTGTPEDWKLCLKLAQRLYDNAQD